MLLVNYQQFVNLGKKLVKVSIEIWGLFSNEKNKNGSIVMEDICPDFIEKYTKVFVCLEAFLKL